MSDTVWEDGIWEAGACSVDVWKGGTFKSGRFTGRIWENGTFAGGTFEGNVWMNGIWKGGIWKGKEWIKGYDIYGHCLRIPPSEWPVDQSLLCFQYNEYERYKQGKETISKARQSAFNFVNDAIRLSEISYADSSDFTIDRKNLFLRQTDEKTMLKRKGLKLFHPDICNSDKKQEYGNLCRVFLELLDGGRIREAEAMIRKYSV